MPNRQNRNHEIARDLMEAAIKYAAGHSYRIGEGAQMHMQDMMAKAARRITYRSARMRGPDAIGGRSQAELVEQLTRQSEQQVHALIDSMIASSLMIPDYAQKQPGVIGERTFFAAVSFICPLWPFC